MVVGDVTTAVDVIILGAGPAGYVAAIRAAQLGKHVTLVEEGHIGGTCLHQGCIPLKAHLSASERYWQMHADELAKMGIHAESITFDWTQMQLWKQGVIERLAEGVRRLITGNRIECIKGKGWFINREEIRVEGEHGSHRFKFEHCILATGATSRPLPSLSYDGVQILSPEQTLALPALPEYLAITGNDYIALELATVFSRLGVKVNLYIPGDCLLPGIDVPALRLVQASLRKQGIQVHTGAAPEAIEERPLVVSNGAQPRTDDLHLNVIDAALNDHGGIAVDSMMRTNIPHIYAIGDCTGGYEGQMQANIAMKQGKVAAEVLAGQRVQFAPLVIPRIVHMTPELATVGLSAEEASQAGYTIKSGRFPMAANGRALTLNSEQGSAFVVANAENDAVLGATLIGPRAGDLIGQIALAIEMGATLTDLTEILYAHPGLGETLLESAESALERAIHTLQGARER
jgi:dihydrolipoamide dehydrogenase